MYCAIWPYDLLAATQIIKGVDTWSQHARSTWHLPRHRHVASAAQAHERIPKRIAPHKWVPAKHTLKDSFGIRKGERRGLEEGALGASAALSPATAVLRWERAERPIVAACLARLSNILVPPRIEWINPNEGAGPRSAGTAAMGARNGLRHARCTASSALKLFIVPFSALRVGQHVIGLGDELEPLLRRRAGLRVLIRMPAQR